MMANTGTMSQRVTTSVTSYAVLHVTRGRDTSRWTADNCCSNNTTIMSCKLIWRFHKAIYLIYKCLKGSRFCDHFLCLQFVPINGIRDKIE